MAMLERAFVFEIATGESHEVVGAGAVCVARREVTFWKAGEGALPAATLPAHQWVRLEQELASSLPTGSLARTSAIARAMSAPFGVDEVRVQYIGVFPMDATEWLPAYHPATAVLSVWQTAAAHHRA